jgi:beta-galactosidase
MLLADDGLYHRPGFPSFTVNAHHQNERRPMKHFSKTIYISGILLLISIGGLSAENRTDRLLNAQWKFTREDAAGASRIDCNDSYWEKVSLPHTWNARDGQDGGGDYYRGTGWYRRSLTLESADKGKSIFLRFDGAASATEVYVNGTLAGKHKGNYGAFCFEVTSLVRVGGTNIIAVRVSNAKDSTISPLRGDFTVYGGIYRSVHLLVLDNLSVSPLDDASPGVYVQQSKVDKTVADLDVTVKLRNGSTVQKTPLVRCIVQDRNGKIVQKAETSAALAPQSEGDATVKLSISTPHLWNGRTDPYLYQVVVEVADGKRVADRVRQPLGIRFFSVDPDKGFFLNGVPYRLHGVNRHQDRENMGSAITSKEHQEDFTLINEIGANAIRLAHYQHAQEFYDLCDTGGMVVWAELALVDDIHPNTEFAQICRQQLRELIKQNFNHPSICFWSMENELVPDSNPELYAAFVKDLHALAKQLDPTRLTTVASRSKYDLSSGMNSATDVIAFNVYRGWYEGKPEDFGAYADKLHQRFPQTRFAISEYGAGGSIHQHEVPAVKPAPRGPWHPEEWQSTLHEITWKAMDERPYLWGTFIWNMFDFGSDGRAEGDRNGRNDKGLVSFDRMIRKDAFFWYKANWNPDPMVHITSKRYTPRPAGVTDLKVYSNCESVELFLDGISLGPKKSADKIFLWTDIELMKGERHIAAIGVGASGEMKDECTIVVINK